MVNYEKSSSIFMISENQLGASFGIELYIKFEILFMVMSSSGLPMFGLEPVDYNEQKMPGFG